MNAIYKPACLITVTISSAVPTIPKKGDIVCKKGFVDEVQAIDWATTALKTHHQEKQLPEAPFFAYRSVIQGDNLSMLHTNKHIDFVPQFRYQLAFCKERSLRKCYPADNVSFV